ncbi:MAG TPA: SlyX family protein [Spongiibacteraceae bacterium]|nr:SlyX family protein [Spongiibacteraceae bacterium]HUH38852.1 SlyX family protein [Spongiibacteraceae bacterium]
MADTLLKQLEDLQTRFAFQEDLVQALDRQVAQQAAALERLQREQQALRDYLLQVLDSAAESAPETPPPHY